MIIILFILIIVFILFSNIKEKFNNITPTITEKCPENSFMNKQTQIVH
jgi:hypothetical protein